MDWSAIEAYAEMLGALAVLISIGYLAAQVRQNTKQLRNEGVQASLAEFNQLRLAMFQDGEAAEIFRRGSQSLDLLEEGEVYRFRSALGHIMSCLWGMHSRIQNDSIDLDMEHLDNLLSNLRLSPGILDMWSQISFQYPAAFRQYVDDRFGTP